MAYNKEYLITNRDKIINHILCHINTVIGNLFIPIPNNYTIYNNINLDLKARVQRTPCTSNCCSTV